MTLFMDMILNSHSERDYLSKVEMKNI